MADFTLTSAPPLAGYDQRFGDIRLSAPADQAIVSIALPLGGEKAALRAIADAYGTDLPAIGKTAATPGGTLLRLAPDQAFVLFQRATPDAVDHVAGKLGETVYLTDQSDVWCALSIEGAGVRDVLARICPLDLHPDVFAIGDVARTVMEHLGAIILRTGAEAFLLLSASSSAQSFQHAVEVSIRNAR